MVINLRIIVVLMAISWGLRGEVVFAQNTQLPSCYNVKIIEEKKTPDTELFVLVDQTTLLDGQLKQQVVEQVQPFLTHGNAINFVVFSSFQQGKYTRVLSSVRLEHKLTDQARADISKPLLAKFDQCLSMQPAYAAQIAGASLRYAFDGISGDLNKSDIFSSLKEISGMVKASQATSKIVLIVSDMLENSSITSFYQSNSVRLIDPEQELANVSKVNGFANFASARIYIIGAGLIPEDLKNNKSIYRDPKTMQALTNFWERFFQKSNSNLIEMGKPALLNQVR